MSTQAAQAGSKGIAALWRRGDNKQIIFIILKLIILIYQLYSITGWHEIPEVMGGCVKGAIGVVLAGIGLRNYYANDGDNRRYKQTYVVSDSNSR